MLLLSLVVLGTTSEAFVEMCSVEKVFLKSLQNSQESICARVSLQLY